MTFEEVKICCHVRSTIYRKSNPSTKYYKNHSIPLEVRIPIQDQKANDWEELDPSDNYPNYYKLA